MRNGILGSLAAMLAGSGIALGQGYYPGYAPPTYYPPQAPPGWQGQMPMQQMPQQQMPQSPMMQQQMMQQQLPMQPLPMVQRPIQQMPYPMPMPSMITQQQPMMRPVPPGYMVGPNGQLMPQQWYPSGVPIYAQPYYPVVRSWGPGPAGYPQASYPQVPMSPPALPPVPNAPAPAPQSAARIPTTAPKNNAITTTGFSGTGAALNGSAIAPVTGWMGIFHKTSQPVLPVAMVDPLPGTPLMAHESGCADGSCGTSACGPHGCGDACVTGCEPKHPVREPRGYCTYGSAEVLYWWLRKQDGPTLFSIFDGRAFSEINPRDLANNQELGGRFTLGHWFNPQQTIGLDVSGFYMGEKHNDTTVSSNLALFRPINDLSIMAPNLLALPAGSGAVLDARTKFYGAEVNFRWDFYRSCTSHIDFMVGPRYLDLEETIGIATTDGLGDSTADSFATRNRFLGLQLGVEGERNWKRYFVHGFAKIAAGNLHQTVEINGATNLAGIGAVPGGFLAQTSNIGQYNRNRFGLLPEAGFDVGMRLTDHVRIYGGYSILFLMNSLRPGDQIDNTVNPTGAGGPGPLFQWNESTFWAQGLKGGLEVRY